MACWRIVYVLGVIQEIHKVCVQAAPCDAAPCQNQGVCTNTANNYTCTCSPGYEGVNCQVNIDDCNGTCLHGGTCTDLVNGFECSCPFGYSGTRCEITEYWTLLQWTGAQCKGKPWRCFKLQVDNCIDTAHVDGVLPTRDNWYGKLQHKDGKYTIDLCFGKKKDPQQQCKCDNHYTNIPKLGKNSLGPPTPGRSRPDSDRCHKLLRITSSMLVLSTGAKDNVSCVDPNSAKSLPHEFAFAISILCSVWFSFF